MALRVGIPLVELFASLDQLNQSLPAKVAGFFRRFVATDLESRVSDGAVIHIGRLQPVIAPVTGEDVEKFDFGLGTLRLPLVNSGIPFQLSKLRSAVTSDLEPGEDVWQFDLLLDNFSLELDGLIAADYISEAGTSPHHLVPKPGNKLAMITGSAGVRFERASATDPIVTRFFSVQGGSDPFVPMRQSGFVGQITMSPPHALIGKSQFGITVRNLLFDFSQLTSPLLVTERGQTAEWLGLAIEEAAIYCPSNAVGRGGFSLTVRDFLIGDPLGIQGELEVQFGQSPLAPSTFVFRQNDEDITSGFDFNNGTLEITALPGEEVTITAALTNIAPPPADSGIIDWNAKFKFPGQGEVVGDTASGTVRHNDRIEITPIEVISSGADDREIEHPAFTVKMVASGTAPEISVDISGTSISNVVDLSGPVDEVAGLALTATSTPADPVATFQWSCRALNIDHEGTTLTLSPAQDTRGIFLLEIVQKDSDRGSLHLRICLRDPNDGALLIGCEGGVFDAADVTTTLILSEILGTYDLTQFHTDGRLAGADANASLAGGAVTVPSGAIAEVSYLEGGFGPITVEDRHVQLLFEYAKNDVITWGQAHPLSGSGTNFHADLLRWAANFPGAKFQVIGRCDDVGTGSYNETLAQLRAAEALRMLTTVTDGLTPITAGDVTERGEQDSTALLPGADVLISPDIAETSVRLINEIEDRTSWPQRPDGNGDRLDPPNPDVENVRKSYRRVDIYAVGGTAQGDASIELFPSVDPHQRRVLVPAVGRDTLPASNQDASADYRVKLVLGWDRPRFTGWEDAVPNLAEFEYAWTPSPADGISVDREVLTVYGKWVYDDLTGFTQFLAGVKSEGDPNGLFKVEQDNIVAALAFGPMLASGVDFDTDAFGSAVRLGALAGITTFAKIDLGGGPLIGDASQAAFFKLEARAETRTIGDPLASYKVQFVFDYTTTMHINGGALGLHTDPDQPMKLRYTDIGLEFDNTDPDAALIDKVGLVYSSDSMSVEDSGLWKIEGPLGQLLRISEFKFGVGSFWVEPTLAIALDLGVVEISEAAFRITFDIDSNGDVILPPGFSLRGLVAKVDIPGVVKGEGRLKIEDNGVVKAAVDATLVPLQARVVVALAVGVPDEIAPSVFLNLYARVQFPGGIPLGSLPIAIHGFIGQTVINGSRDVANIDDVVTREIGWWRKNPEDKYKPEKGQYALGFGIVLGTLPDASFSLSVTGMVVVAFPDPEVILGVEVELLSIPDTTAKDKKEGNTASITGLVVINTEAVTIAISAEYEIPHILTLKVPFGAYFPGTGADTYVRLGADGVHGRSGEPITIQILPSTLNLKAWAYLMIEGGGIIELGGREGWDFPGFAIGFGTGVAIGWEAGPFELSASAALYVGIGTDPLLIKGGMVVRGKLDLVVVSATISGEITLSYLAPEEGDAILALEDAKFCAEVDLFFFTVSGCVDLSFGLGASFTAPEPDPPVASISLTDRLYAITGEARNNAAPQAHPLFNFVEVDDETVNQGVPPEDNHTVWLDTVPVLNFRHFAQDAMASTAQFDPSSQPGGEKWFGSNRLRYAYRLDDVRLIRVSDETLVEDPTGAKLMSVWSHVPSRPADDTSGTGSQEPSGAEKTHLQLLNWEPWAWAHGTENGGEGQPGDPAGTVGRLCDPVPEPARACLLGRDAMILTGLDTRLRRPTPAPGPYPSRFLGRGESFLPLGAGITGTELTTLFTTYGFSFHPGEMAATPTVQIEGRSVTGGYRLPWVERIMGDALETIFVPWRAKLNRDVVHGELTLLVCQNDTLAPNGPCYEFDGVKPGSEFLYREFPPFTARSLQPGLVARRVTLRTQDGVDLSQSLNPVFGQDNRVELNIPNSGAALDLKVSCHQLVLHSFRPGDEDVKFTVRHADGTVTIEISSAPADRPIQTNLSSNSGIVSVEIEPLGKEVWLYRVCCKKPGDRVPPIRRECIDFTGLKRDIVEQPKFEHDGARFETLKPSDTFGLRDFANAGLSPVRPGPDGVPDLALPEAGVAITLPAECAHLVVGVILGAGPVTVVGFDANGSQVAKVVSQTLQSFGQELNLISTGAPIVRIEIAGGDGEAILYRICCEHRDGQKPTGSCIELSNLPHSINGRHRVVHEGLVLTAEPGGRLSLSDRVTVGTPTKARSDRRMELQIPSQGLRITLPRGCLVIDVYLMLFASTPVTIIGLNANGQQVAKVSTGQKQRVEDVVRLVANTPITTLILQGGSGEAVLYRLCCRSGDVNPPRKRCINFKGATLRGKTSELKHEGFVFRNSKKKETLELMDRVDGSGNIVLRRGDGIPELAFDTSGLTIDLPRAASFVQLTFYARKGAEYKVTATNDAGKELTGKGAKLSSGMARVKLTAEGMTRIEVQIEDQALLSEICVHETGVVVREDVQLPSSIATAAATTDLPKVTSEDRNTAATAAEWPGQILQAFPREGSKTCYLVRYRMPAGVAPADVVSVVPTLATGQEVTMISLCAVDHRAARLQEQDEAVRTDLADAIEDADPLDGRPVLLDPDTEYRIEVDWSWQVWQGVDDNDTPPVDPPLEDFLPASETQVFRFKTAPQDTSLPTRQEGPNEYIFDPRDLDRYLLASEPETGAIAHFTEDPVVFHFSQDHISNLLERYSRELEIEVRRTDPPPQPDGDFSLVTAKLLGSVGFFYAPAETQTVSERRINEVVAELPCIENDRPLGGVTLAGTYPLAPNVMYDADLFAQSISTPTDKVQISAANFRTSRYANPDEMIRAMGCATDGSVYPIVPEELVLEQTATLPNDIRSASDIEFDQAMAAMGLETLGLPTDTPRLFQLWRTNVTGTALEMVGLLLDAVEPVNRTASVIQDDSVARVNRCSLSHATIDAVRFDVARQTRNATRLLLVPTVAFTVPDDPASFQLVFDTSDGQIVGRKQIRGLSLVIELEGF